MSRVPEDERLAFKKITSLNFIGQAKVRLLFFVVGVSQCGSEQWFLNGFWSEVGDQAEFFWKVVNIMNTISAQKAKGSVLFLFFLCQLISVGSGSELDELCVTT